MGRIWWVLSLFLLVSCSREKQRLLEYGNINDPINLPQKSQDHFSLLSYNIKAINAKSTEEIAAFVHHVREQSYDIITLQEVFSENTRQALVDSLSGEYYANIARVDYGGWRSFSQDAGLMIFSKFPSIGLSELPICEGYCKDSLFVHRLLAKQVSITLDHLANKSVAGCFLQVPNDKILFINTTHVQALGTRKHKLKQIGQIHEFMAAASEQFLQTNNCESEQLAVLLTGDFNQNAYTAMDYDGLTSQLQKPIDVYKNSQGDRIQYTFRSGFGNMMLMFDYVFAFQQFRTFQLGEIEVIDCQIGDVKVEGRSISDHYPIATIISF